MIIVTNTWEFMQRINEKYLSGLFKDPQPKGASSNSADQPEV